MLRIRSKIWVCAAFAMSCSVQYKSAPPENLDTRELVNAAAQISDLEQGSFSGTREDGTSCQFEVQQASLTQLTFRVTARTTPPTDLKVDFTEGSDFQIYSVSDTDIELSRGRLTLLAINTRSPSASSDGSDRQAVLVEYSLPDKSPLSLTLFDQSQVTSFEPIDLDDLSPSLQTCYRDL